MTREMPATISIGVQIGTGGGTRTPDTQFRKLVLYPLSYARSTSHGTIRPAIKGMMACQCRLSIPATGWSKPASTLARL